MRPAISTFSFSTQYLHQCGSISRDIMDANPAMTSKQESDLLNRFSTFIHSFDRKLDLSNLNIKTIPASLKNAGRINQLTVSPNFIFETNAASKLFNINSITIDQSCMRGVN